ncbi:MAG TPA: hypothetical protein VLM37_00560 [Fibrobacteraceae bacterium]|nr:hypothetical protein [Fibrobacteraceae bacterium]
MAWAWTTQDQEWLFFCENAKEQEVISLVLEKYTDIQPTTIGSFLLVVETNDVQPLLCQIQKQGVSISLIEPDSPIL